jgi:hypothetical protein
MFGASVGGTAELGGGGGNVGGTVGSTGDIGVIWPSGPGGGILGGGTPTVGRYPAFIGGAPSGVP